MPSEMRSHPMLPFSTSIANDLPRNEMSRGLPSSPAISMLFSCGEYLIHDRIEVAFFKEIGILVFLFQRQCAGNGAFGRSDGRAPQPPAPDCFEASGAVGDRRLGGAAGAGLD